MSHLSPNLRYKPDLDGYLQEMRHVVAHCDSLVQAAADTPIALSSDLPSLAFALYERARQSVYLLSSTGILIRLIMAASNQHGVPPDHAARFDSLLRRVSESSFLVQEGLAIYAASVGICHMEPAKLDGFLERLPDAYLEAYEIVGKLLPEPSPHLDYETYVSLVSCSQFLGIALSSTPALLTCRKFETLWAARLQYIDYDSPDARLLILAERGPRLKRMLAKFVCDARDDQRRLVADLDKLPAEDKTKALDQQWSQWYRRFLADLQSTEADACFHEADFAAEAKELIASWDQTLKKAGFKHLALKPPDQVNLTTQRMFRATAIPCGPTPLNLIVTRRANNLQGLEAVFDGLMTSEQTAFISVADPLVEQFRRQGAGKGPDFAFERKVNTAKAEDDGPSTEFVQLYIPDIGKDLVATPLLEAVDVECNTGTVEAQALTAINTITKRPNVFWCVEGQSYRSRLSYYSSATLTAQLAPGFILGNVIVKHMTFEQFKRDAPIRGTAFICNGSTRWCVIYHDGALHYTGAVEKTLYSFATHIDRSQQYKPLQPAEVFGVFGTLDRMRELIENADRFLTSVYAVQRWNDGGWPRKKPS
jgi:hypothetical protein